MGSVICKFPCIVKLKKNGIARRMWARVRQLGVGRVEELDTERKGKGVDKRNTTSSQLSSLVGYVFTVVKCLEMFPNNLLAK